MQVSKFKILHLSKENLKFSAAHFLIFDEHRAERLHGHNYRVVVEVKVPWESFVEVGYGIDFSVLKQKVKAQLDEWDEHVLLPAKHKDFRISTQGESLDVRFRERHYVFPRAEVVLLPIVNTSVELLSELLAESFGESFKDLGILGVQVQVEETLGQSAKSFWGDFK
jgi:6-pyruvoyltetrahydropterin/6-carboxytetrahydropterin synthase